MTDPWSRISAWHAKHAPAVHATLRGPASSEDLTMAEQEMGRELPADLVAWWRQSDGVDEANAVVGPLLPPFHTPYPITWAVASRRIWQHVWPDEAGPARPAGTECRSAWLPDWLPIATDGGSADLFVDLRPGPLHGCVMEFDRVEGAYGRPWWPNIDTMLTEIADALENRTTIRPAGRYPVRIALLPEGRTDWAQTLDDHG